MWYGSQYFAPPSNKDYRTRIAKEIFGWGHGQWCENGEVFHVPYLHKKKTEIRYDYANDGKKNPVYCICKVCKEQMEWRHDLFCMKS